MRRTIEKSEGDVSEGSEVSVRSFDDQCGQDNSVERTNEMSGSRLKCAVLAEESFSGSGSLLMQRGLRKMSTSACLILSHLSRPSVFSGSRHKLRAFSTLMRIAVAETQVAGHQVGRSSREVLLIDQQDRRDQATPISSLRPKKASSCPPSVLMPLPRFVLQDRSSVKSDARDWMLARPPGTGSGRSNSIPGRRKIRVLLALLR